MSHLHFMPQLQLVPLWRDHHRTSLLSCQQPLSICFKERLFFHQRPSAEGCRNTTSGGRQPLPLGRSHVQTYFIGVAGSADRGENGGSIDFDLDLPVQKMSKGMRQRLALAMALIPLPNVLLLDEPEAGLDPAQRIGLRERIKAFARFGRIVVLASHDVPGLASIADDTYLISSQGIARLDAAELADSRRVVELFTSVAHE